MARTRSARVVVSRRPKTRPLAAGSRNGARSLDGARWGSTSTPDEPGREARSVASRSAAAGPTTSREWLGYEFDPGGTSAAKVEAIKSYDG